MWGLKNVVILHCWKQQKGQDFIIKRNQLVDQTAKEATRHARPGIHTPLQVLRDGCVGYLEATATDKPLYKAEQSYVKVYKALPERCYTGHPP